MTTESSTGKKSSILDTIINNIKKEYGEGAIMSTSTGLLPGVECVPTDILSLDIALGGKGLPRGRIIEIFGPESSGKTTLTLQIMASFMKHFSDKLFAFIDAEHALDLEYARALGVDLDRLLISQPSCGEEALSIVDSLVPSGEIPLIIVDSVAALTPKAELEGEMGDSAMGLHARLMSQAMRKLTGAASQSKTTIIFINQLRSKIGVVYGNPEVTTGGNALKFYASQRLDIRKKEAEKDGEHIIGNRTKIKIVKNKIAPPFKETEVLLRFGTGIDKVDDLVSIATTKGIVEKAGTWYRYKGESIGQGLPKACAYFNDHPEVIDDIYKQVINKL